MKHRSRHAAKRAHGQVDRPSQLTLFELCLIEALEHGLTVIDLT
jgi:hypothetical protein